MLLPEKTTLVEAARRRMAPEDPKSKTSYAA